MSSKTLAVETRRKKFTSTRYYYTKAYVRKFAQIHGVEVLRTEFKSALYG